MGLERAMSTAISEPKSLTEMRLFLARLKNERAIAGKKLDIAEESFRVAQERVTDAEETERLMLRQWGMDPCPNRIDGKHGWMVDGPVDVCYYCKSARQLSVL